MIFIKFDVFGKKMSVSRDGNEWLLFLDSDMGKRIRVYDVVIPSDLKESDLAGYLSDMFHEHADEKNSSVIRLN